MGGTIFIDFVHTPTHITYTHTQTIFDQRLAYAIPFFFFGKMSHIKTERIKRRSNAK